MANDARQVRARLRDHPDLLAVLDHLVEASGRAGFGLAVKGSLVKGTVDRFSDLDLTLLASGSVAAAGDWLGQRLSEVGRPVAHFPATHLGLPSLWIHFLERGGRIVKVDVDVVDRARFEAAPDEVVLVDSDVTPEEAIATAPVPAPDPDLGGVHQRFTGWVWYTYLKLARGELMEACDSLGVMRAQALMKAVQAARRLPFEGFRWAERRLSASDYAAIERTFPSAVERYEILRALVAMVSYFRRLEPDLRALGVDAASLADLDATMDALYRHEREIRHDARPEGGFGRHPPGGVFHHQLLPEGGQIESALVFRLESQLAGWIEMMRHALPFVPPERELAPHLTVLFLGQADGPTMTSLHARLSILHAEAYTVRLERLDVFRKGDVITDVHIRVAEDETLLALHRRALDICEACGHTPQSPFVGAAYVPHITIASGLDLPAAKMPDLGGILPPDGPVRLGDPYIMLRRISDAPPRQNTGATAEAGKGDRGGE